jgi:hypothetical protein
MLRTLSLVLLVGCASESLQTTPCDEASATLEHCTGQVPDGFREACAADPETVASTVLAETDAASCTGDGRADGVKQTVFVGACSALVNAAYWVVWARSPSSKPLSNELKTKLRPWFGELVDTARVSWGSDLLARWRVFGRDIILDEDTAAQTFGHEIFVHDAAGTDDATVSIIGHELGHVAQYKRLGGVSGFAREYCEAFYEANFSYRNNALEVEAYDTQGRIETCLAYGSDCP